MDFSNIVSAAGNEFAQNASDMDETQSYIDTGSYTLNAIISGSIYKGLPGNKVTAYAGEQATGKTFFVFEAVKNFLQSNTDGRVLFFETENALEKGMFDSRGIDSSRITIFPVATIEEFKSQAVRILDAYLAIKEDSRPPLLMCLDSLGMLSTAKEVNDTTTGSDKADFTRPKLIRSAFRVLTLKLGRANVPLLITNHTYTSVGSFIPTQTSAGGGGLKYAASSIVLLSKKQVKEGTEKVGNIVKIKMEKSRFTKEGSSIETKIDFEKGLDRYHGMIELGLEAGVFQKSGNRILVGESKLYPKAIYDDPEKYFTKEILDTIDEYVIKRYSYGTTDTTEE